MLELILITGAIGPAIFGAAWLLWLAGVRDPFILTVSAIALGGVVGWAVNRGVDKLVAARDRASTRERRRGGRG